MSHPGNGVWKRLSSITSSILRFQDDVRKGKESLREKRKVRSMENRDSHEGFWRSHRFCACLVWENRHEERALTQHAEPCRRAARRRVQNRCERQNPSWLS